MATNSNLQMSRAGKTDEFYTQLSTIEEELRHYRTSPIFYTQVNIVGEDKPTGLIQEGKKPYKIEITEVKNSDGNDTVDMSDVS